MAISLIREVVAYLPGTDHTTAERLALFAIAEAADGTTREAYQCNGENGKKRWVLAEVVGVGNDGLKSILQRLARRDLEVRVAIGKDTNGKVMYAVKGRQTTYRLPLLPGVYTPPKEPYGGVPASNGGERTPDGGVSSPPFSSASRSYSSSSSEPRQIVMNHTDAKPSEADAVVARIVNERNLTRPGGFIAHLAKAGELQGWVNQVRAARTKADRDEAEVTDRKARQGLSRCFHGVQGGELPNVVTREIRCKDCRDIQHLNNPKEK